MKCALVTGGSRGIGRAICYKLAGMGYHILISYKGNEAAANETLEKIKTDGGSAELLRFDLSDKEQITTVLGGWIETHTEKYIEVLINNGGIKDDGLLMWMKD